MGRLTLLIAALVTAFCGQYLLTPLGASRAFSKLPKEHAPLGFVLLLSAGLIAAVVVWRAGRAPATGAIRASPAPPAPEPRLMYGAVALVGVAVLGVLHDFSCWWAIYPWAVGLLLLVAAVAGSSANVSMPRFSGWEWLAVLVVVGVAVAFRLPELAEVPAQVHGDEAACGLEARRILNGEVGNLLGIGWYDIPYLSFAISAFFMAIFGDDLFGLRMASVVFGVVSVPLLFATVRRLYGTGAGFLAAYLLAVSHWHVHFSRIGTDYMQASFATLMAIFFFVRARETGRGIDWVAAGLATGLACSVYFAGRVSLLILGAVLLWDWLADRRADRALARGVTLMSLAAILFVAPVVAAMAWLPSMLVDRSSGVFVLSPANLEHSRAALGEAGLGRVLMAQSVQSLTAFNWRGETSEQHSHPAPLLDFWSGAIFAVGLVAFTSVGWRRRYRLIALWFWLNLMLGSILTVDAMFSPRMIVAVPVVFVFAALVLELYRGLALQALGKRGGVVASLSLLAFLAASTLANYRDYFDLHVRQLQPAGAATVLSRFLEHLDEGERVYLYGSQSVGYDTPRFLVPDANAVDMGDGPLVLPAREPGAKAIVVVESSWPGADALAAAVEARCPQSRASRLRLADGRAVFEVYRLEQP